VDYESDPVEDPPAPEYAPVVDGHADQFDLDSDLKEDPEEDPEEDPNTNDSDTSAMVVPKIDELPLVVIGPKIEVAFEDESVHKDEIDAFPKLEVAFEIVIVPEVEVIPGVNDVPEFEVVPGVEVVP
ncbi:hypothetical protein Tco_1340365, partial [Tanacetum coccineum]